MNGDGQISEKNIKQAFSKFGMEVTDEEIAKIWEVHDEDGDKTISLAEFETIFGLNQKKGQMTQQQAQQKRRMTIIQRG